jgi:hypothetical protein
MNRLSRRAFLLEHTSVDAALDHKPGSMSETHAS